MKNNKNDNIGKVMSALQGVYRDLPYYKSIRASWKANISHCEKGSSSVRDTLVKKNIAFCKEWLGELGFVRYYLFHIENGYVAGQSKLERINQAKGFNPSNCQLSTRLKRNARKQTFLI